MHPSCLPTKLARVIYNYAMLSKKFKVAMLKVERIQLNRTLNRLRKILLELRRIVYAFISSVNMLLSNLNSPQARHSLCRYSQKVQPSARAQQVTKETELAQQQSAEEVIGLDLFYKFMRKYAFIEQIEVLYLTSIEVCLAASNYRGLIIVNTNVNSRMQQENIRIVDVLASLPQLPSS